MRYDLRSPRPKKDGGTHWHPVGSMWSNNNGGFSIILDSSPYPDKEGRVVVMAFEPREQQQGSQPYNAGSQQQAPAAGSDGDDEIPF